MKVCLRGVRNFQNIPKKFFTVSKLSQIKQRDEEFLNKVIQSENYSVNEFSNFMRVINNRVADEQMLKRFNSELPKHINKLDHLDTRKAMSILLNNEILRSNEQLVTLVKDRFAEIKKIKNIKKDEIEIKIGNDNKHQPLSVRFWIGYARLRETLYEKFRQTFKINLQ